MRNDLTRRGLLRTAVTAAGAAACIGQEPGGRSPSGPVRLGGPVFNPPEDPEELALAHRKLGYAAAYCPGVKLEDAPRISAIAAAFRKHDVVIAEVGRWVNLLDADADKRAANLKTVTEGLALAEAIGALCCVDIAGSFSTREWFGPHPDNLSEKFFDAAVENARKIIDAVRPRRAKFCYEMMAWSLPDSPEACARMLKAVDRPAFAVHVDVCNLVNSPTRFYRNAELIEECFDKLGPHVVSCHAKDLTWDVEMSIHFREVGAGEGSIDYRTYLRRVAALPHRPPLMIEHLPDAAAYEKAAKAIRKVGGEIGVRFA
ncbi:MAG: sugar phosphate isomerase/epimerase [Phycisphaerae bacterium]|jgi:sugar phosphate isomerase/epimerase